MKERDLKEDSQLTEIDKPRRQRQISGRNGGEKKQFVRPDWNWLLAEGGQKN